MASNLRPNPITTTIIASSGSTDEKVLIKVAQVSPSVDQNATVIVLFPITLGDD